VILIDEGCAVSLVSRKSESQEGEEDGKEDSLEGDLTYEVEQGFTVLVGAGPDKFETELKEGIRRRGNSNARGFTFLRRQRNSQRSRDGLHGVLVVNQDAPVEKYVEWGMVAPTGIEPVLSALKGPRVNQLHHGAKNFEQRLW
jgi:hypothetical protein